MSTGTCRATYAGCCVQRLSAADPTWPSCKGPVSQETKEAISDDLSGLEEQINQVADMDKFLERHLRSIRTQSDAKSNKLGQVLHRFEASRASSMAVLQSVQSSDWRSGGNAASAGGEPENATLGGAEGNDAAEQAGTAPGGEDPKPKGESTEKVKEMLTALAAEAVAMSGNEPLLEADMTGVDEMKRDEMWEEIRSRREREIQLMALVAKMEQMHNEGGRHIAKGSSSAEDVGKSRGDSTSDNKAEEGGRGPDKRAPAWEEAGFKSQKTFLTRLTKALLGHPGIKSSNEAANEEERKAKKTSFRLPQEEEASATERLHADSSESWRMATKYNSPSKKNPGGIEAEGGAATDGAYAFPSQQEVFGDAFKVHHQVFPPRPLLLESSQRRQPTADCGCHPALLVCHCRTIASRF